MKEKKGEEKEEKQREKDEVVENILALMP